MATGKKGGKTRGRKVDTRRRIIDVARRLFSDTSFGEVSMDAIAAKVRVTKPDLYYYFKSKRALYREVVDSAVDDAISVFKKAAQETDPMKRFRYGVENYLEFGYRQKNLIKAMIAYIPPEHSRDLGSLLELRARVTSFFMPLFVQMLAAAPRHPKRDPLMLTNMLVWMLNGMLLDHYWVGTKPKVDVLMEQFGVMLKR